MGSWVGIKHFVARLDQRHHCQRERHFAAGCNQNLFGFHFELSCAPQVFRDGCAQCRNAPCGNVAIVAVGYGRANGIHYRCGGMKVRFAQLQVDDGAALFFQFLGAGEDGESAFAGQE